MPKPYRQFWFACCCLMWALSTLHSAQPQITSDENFYDAETRQLTFLGDAVLVHGDVRLEADEIRYDRTSERAIATGNVRVTRPGLRLVATELVYNLRERHFEARDFRVGSPPIFAEGGRITGTARDILLEDAAIFPGEPHPRSPHLTARTARVIPRESFHLGSPRFQPGLGIRGLTVPLPDFSSSIEDPGIRFQGYLGFRHNLGAYFQTDTLFPVRRGVRVGGALDAYTRRGVLAGPSIQLYSDTPGHTRMTAIRTGFIRDAGDRGNDRLGVPIERDRGFLSLRHLQRYEENLTLTAKVDWLGDSEALRDFRELWFRSDQQPDNFVEAAYLWRDTLLSAFTRFDPNAFHTTLERLPEVRIDHLGTEIARTSAYQQFSLSWARMREIRRTAFPADPFAADHVFRHQVDRFDAWYAVRRPVALTAWANLTPVAGIRATHWANADRIPGSYTREMGMLGADLELHAHAAWEFRSESWDIDGLRHIVKPVFQYRWLPGGRGDPGRVIVLDRPMAAPYPAPLDFANMRDIDLLDDRHLLRIGVQNLLQTRSPGYGSRTLAEAHLYQDLYFSRSAPYPGAANHAWHATFAQVRLRPAPWLEVDWEHMLITESLRREADRVRVAIVDGDVWHVAVFSEFLKSSFEQYGIEGARRLTDTFEVLGQIRYDARTDRWTEQRYALRQRLNRYWEIEYRASVIRGSTREDDLRLSIGLHFIDF